MYDDEPLRLLSQSHAGTIYLNGLRWASEHGGTYDDMYRFAGDYLDRVVFDPDTWMGGSDAATFAAENAEAYPSLTVIREGVTS